MQMEEVTRLQREWEAKGSPPCSHPKIVKEFYLSAKTGDKVCTTCGEENPSRRV